MANNNKVIYKRILELVTSVEFIVLTILGNFFIFLCSFVLFYLEKDVNPNINEFIDAIWLCFSTVTSVGYGDVVPVTNSGKIFGIMLMLLGTAMFAVYTALFANAILGDYAKRFKGLFKGISTEEEHMSKTIEELHNLINTLKENNKK